MKALVSYPESRFAGIFEDEAKAIKAAGDFINISISVTRTDKEIRISINHPDYNKKPLFRVVDVEINSFSDDYFN